MGEGVVKTRSNYKNEQQEEEYWGEVRVEVKPVGNVIASMNCNSSVALGKSVQCTVHLELESAGTVTLNLEEVDFGGKKVWPNGPSSVKVSKQTVTLTPTNMQEDLTITIDIDDELANYYFGKPVYRTYIDKFADHSYLLKAKFSELNYPVSDVITIIYKDTRSNMDRAIDYGSTAGEIISTAYFDLPVSGIGNHTSCLISILKIVLIILTDIVGLLSLEIGFDKRVVAFTLIIYSGLILGISTKSMIDIIFLGITWILMLPCIIAKKIHPSSLTQ